jgi:hypothetical protein
MNMHFPSLSKDMSDERGEPCSLFRTIVFAEHC